MSNQQKKVSLTHEKWGRIEIEFPHKGYFLLLIALIIPYLLVTGYVLGRIEWQPLAHGTNQVASAPASQGTPCAPGPWGNMSYRRISIQSPEEYLAVSTYETSDARWHFGAGKSKGDVLTLFNQAGLDAGRRQQLEKARWDQDTNGLSVTPPPDLTLSLSAPLRQKIYTALARYSENTWQRHPCFFPAGKIEDLFAKDGLSAQSLKLLAQLSYSHGQLLFFADLPLALRQLADPGEKARLTKAVSRRSTLLTGVRLTPDSNIETLLTYWARAGQSKDLRPLFEGLSKTAGGGLPLMAIIPVRASSRLFTFPNPTMSAAERENPNWTSFNFFRDPPDDRFSDGQFMKQKLESDYYPVFSDPSYGDLVFLMTASGEIIHSAVFIADNIVYTKSGGPFIAPWLLMTTAEMQDAFSAMAPPNEPFRLMYYRDKYY